MNHKTYRNHRNEPYFTFLKNGQKTIEGRIKKGKYTDIAPKDHIVVSKKESTETIEVLVIGVRTYKTFKEMLSHEPLQKVLPNTNSIDAGAAIYRQFYSAEQEKQYGVVAIEITLI